MYKRISSIVLTAALVAGLLPATSLPVKAADTYSPNLLSQSGMENVTLADSYLLNASRKNIDYLLTFDTDRLLVEFRKTAGLDTRGKANYGGWEAGYGQGTRFTGHFVGHYISALSQTYRATNATAEEKTQIGIKLKALVDGVREAQLSYGVKDPANSGFLPAFGVTALPYGEQGLLVPFYNLHKVVQGMLDAYKWAPEQATKDKALATASDFASFLVKWQTAKGMSKADMLRTEYGGMNEALYELYDYTGNSVHLQAASNFDETALFQQLASNQDPLNGLHANTTIPKLIGALKRYVVLTENPTYYNQLTATQKTELNTLYKAAAINFWQMVIDHHTYIIGDNSQSEHFHGADGLWYHATQTGTGNNGYNANSTAETCNSYNMLKLTRLLFQVTKDVKYSEYYEHTFINTIMASQNPESGMVTYFQPMMAGYSKVFSVPYGELWCDQGTGVENFAKLADSIYFTDQNNIYVNMFRSSTFTNTRHNLRLTQTANIPKQDTVTYRVEQLSTTGVAAGTNLKLRVPQWITPGGFALTVNGVQQNVAPVNGWLTVPVTNGTQISYKLTAKVQVIDAPDNANWVGFQYGPTVLAAPLSTTNVGAWYYGGVLVRMASFDAEANAKAAIFPAAGVNAEDWKTNIAQNLVRVDQPTDASKLQFKLRNVDATTADFTFEPYYSLYQARYAIYMDLAVVDSPAYQNMILTQKQKLREDMRTVDSLSSFDNNNSEFGKGLQTGGTSTVGNYNGLTYRDAKGPDGWFSYNFAVDKAAARNYLAVRYTTADAGRTFDIYVNGTKLKTETINNLAGSNVFYNQFDEIPSSVVQAAPLVNGKGQVTVRFQANSTSFVGGVYGVRTVTKTAFDTNPRLQAMTFDQGVLSPAAFSPDVSDYVLTVPITATSVNARFTPALPGGYVRVNGIVIDDTKVRNLVMQGNLTTFNISSYAEDHTTVKNYTLTIAKQGTTVPSGSVITSGATYRMVNFNSGKVLGIAGMGTTDGAQAVQWTDNNTNDHNWRFDLLPSGYYKITNLHSGKVLGISGMSTAAGAQAVQWADNGTIDHEWKLEAAGDGIYKIRNRNSNKVLGINNASTADNAFALQWDDTGSNDHLWALAMNTGLASGATYKLQNVNSSKVLGVTGMSTADGAQTVQWADTGTADHNWRFELQKDGYYKITNVNSGKVLGVEGQSTVDGGKAVQFTGNGSPDQAWRLIDMGGGSFKLVNKNSKKVLGIDRMQTTDGAVALQWTDNATNDQRWKFVSVP
jgi:uncharacterized protein